MSAPLRVAVAGASGFVGSALVRALTPRHRVIALGRNGAGRPSSDRVEWRACDLFNLRSAESALDGADVAVYLVHSMLPPARLTQGRFDDLDLVCADNFARAAARHGVRNIVYLGGLLPADRTALSLHLASRREVERALASHGAAVTTLRAGLVIGAGGSSFDMMAKLVKRLPVMITPRWTRSLCQPIALTDVVPLLVLAIDTPELAGRAYDVGGPDVLSYADMLRMTGRAFGERKLVLTVPVRTAKLSLLWVSAITGAPQALVRPLVESLSHDMIVTDGAILQKRASQAPQPIESAIAQAIDEERRAPRTKTTATTRAPKRRARSTVCSIQRFPLPRGRDARWAAEEYMRWLPRFLGPVLRVEVEGERVRFFFGPLAKPLLELTHSPERSSSDRHLFYVTGGSLAGVADEGARPRLEFRSVLGGAFLLAAINDFVPRLPWLVYKLTQALVHLWVMRSFGRHVAHRGAAAPAVRRGAAGAAASLDESSPT